MQNADNRPKAPSPDAGLGQRRSIRGPRFPYAELAAALFATFGLIGWLLWTTAADNRAYVAFLDRVIRVTELRGTITHLDELLTMSARVAAASGNMRWQTRYNYYVPALEVALAEAMEFAPPAARSAVDEQTRAASNALIALETAAFDAARAGNLTDATELLESRAYAEEKERYGSGMMALKSALQEMIAAQSQARERAMAEQLFLAVVVSLFAAAMWLNLAMTVQKWRRRTTGSEVRASRLAEAAWEGILIHNERAIIDANRAFTTMAGADVDALVGRAMLELFPSEQRAAVDAINRTPESDFIEATLLRDDGTTIPVELRSRPFDVEGQPALITAIRDVSERKRAAERIRHLAHYDSLTELPNRVLFWDRLGQALAMARRHQEMVAILCIDLDHFKEVNDTLGHAAGDRLLKQAAQRLSGSLRDSDTLARLGGDEFAVIMTNLREGHLAAECAKRIIDALSVTFDLDGNDAVIGASVGIALSNPEGEDEPETLLRCADLALYRAKTDGRGGFCFYAEEMNVRLQARKALERQLRQAMLEGQFELYYQPQVEAGSWRILGVEALIRWRHPERGMVMPSEFVPLAEETGLIIPLGEWVLRTACKQAQPWGDLRLAVNLSATQFRQPGLEDAVARALAESGLDPQRLEVEVTETILLQDIEASLATLQKIKRLGVRIAMDDFGTGYSSLSYLRTFPFDKIKIDRSFIHDLGHAEEASAIVRAVVQLGRSLGIRTSAEGVETRAQADILVLDGCDEVQGYHFGLPMSGDELYGMLQRAGTQPLSLPPSVTAA